MRAILHYVLMLAGLIVLGWITGFKPMMWVAVALFVSLATHAMTGVIARADEHAQSRYTLQLIWLCTVGSLVLAALAAIFLFMAYGWVAALGLVILYLIYFLSREDNHSRWKREVAKARASLVTLVAQRGRGRLTQEQLERQAFATLEQELPPRVYGLKFLYEPFLSNEGMSAGEYQIFLGLLERYLSNAERLSVYSGMHQTVRVRLGMQPLR
jgi:hypothetical protein